MKVKKIIQVLLAIGLSTPVVAQTTTPAELAEQQLKAYNIRNIEEFLLPYSDSVKVYNFPNKLLYKGKEIMRRNYAGMFNNSPDLNCQLVSRMVVGNTVIDEEQVLFKKDQPRFHAVAIYKIAYHKIQEVYFISER